jgi:hypothetical protein
MEPSRSLTNSAHQRSPQRAPFPCGRQYPKRSLAVGLKLPQFLLVSVPCLTSVLLCGRRDDTLLRDSHRY